MELPVLCSCNHENMVDWENLESRPLSKLYTVEGSICQGCGKWKPLFYLTPQLEENMRRLKNMQPSHPSFWYRFRKTAKRAEELQRRGRSIS